MSNNAEPSVETPVTTQFLTPSSVRAPISGAWLKPVAVPESRVESLPSTLSSSRRTANFIIALGPATEDGGLIRKLMKAGVRVFGLDGSILERDRALRAVYALRSISTDLGHPVALVLDTGSASKPEEAQARLRFGVECGADWFVAPQGSGADGLRAVRQFLADHKRSNNGVLAQIDTGASSQAAAEILAHADGALITTPLFEGTSLEQIQVISSQCRLAHKAVILRIEPARVGTVGESLLKGLEPDAWLVREDAVARGNPLQTVEQFADLLSRPLATVRTGTQLDIPRTSQRDETVASALRRAEESNADAVLLFTQAGRSAALCAALRPRRARVFAFTPDTRLVRRLMLHGAIEPRVLSFTDQSDKTVRAAEKLLLEKKLLPLGARLVIVTENQDEDQRLSSLSERTLEQR